MFLRVDVAIPGKINLLFYCRLTSLYVLIDMLRLLVENVKYIST